MPLQKLQFRPGVNREGTNYSNEGGFYECDKIRFRSGFPEKIGGWMRLSSNTFVGVCRTLWNWITLASNNLTAVGTNLKYYVESGGTYNDITPLSTTVTLANNPFATVSGSPLVTVTHAGHGATAGTYVTYSGVSGGGVVNGVTLNGEFQIVTVPDGNSYTIIGAANASGTGSGGGAAVSAAYQINAGLATYTVGTGFGAGAWSRGTWGSGTTVGVGTQLTLWSQDNFGQNLIFAPRGGPMYYWAVDVSTWARGITLQSSANATTKYTTTATFLITDTTIVVPQSAVAYLTPGMVVAGSGIAAGTYITTAYTYSTSVPISAAATGGSSGSYTFSYAGRLIPNTVNQVIMSDVQRIVIAIGANPYDPTNFSSTFDPMLVRWSDVENLYEWVPSSSNSAGEQRLSHGSYLVSAQIARQEILVWSDAALYSMQYVGSPNIWGFTLLMDNTSIISPSAAATVNNLTFWMGVDKFYVYSGRVETLPCTLRQYVFGDLNSEQAWQVVCGTNEGFNEVWWHYPSAGSTVNDRYVIYNHLERIWYYGTLNRTAWEDSPLKTYPMGVFSIQQSWLNTAADSSVTSLVLINGSSYPASGTVTIESEQITYTGVSGNTLTGCTRGANGTTAASHSAYLSVSYSASNTIVFHEAGVDDAVSSTNEPIESYIGSSDFDIGDGHNYGFVWRMIPDINFDESTASEPAVTLSVRPRRFPGTAYGTSASPSVVQTQSSPVSLYTEQVYTRIRGRQMSFRIDSDGLGVQWQLGTPRIDIRPDGRKT